MIDIHARRALKAAIAICLLMIVLIILQGCVSTGGPLLAPCEACVGPYDMGLTSHREAVLGKEP